MPSATIPVPNIQNEGACLDVQFLVPTQLEQQFITQGLPVPKPVLGKALIDTGASACVVQDIIPQKLGLSPIGTIGINTPSSQGHSCYQYFMRMIIPLHGLVWEGVFIAAPLQGQNVDSLLGRDLLANGILIYIGYANEFTLSLM